MACVRTIRSLVAVGLSRHGIARDISRRARAARASLHFLALILSVTLALPVLPAATAPATAIRATLAVTTSDGYARIVFSANEYIEATTKTSGHVLIISFKQPIDVSVDRLPELAADYVGAARRDPDGSAIRLALSQNLTVNMMGAGEKLFIDLLPASWSGPPPPLPMDVVNDLAKRARDAERQLQRERQLTQAKYVAPIRVHVASMPTFTRYVFDVTGKTAVAADRAKDRLILNFSAPLTFDLADAQAALPVGVQAITSELETDSSLVRFVFGTNVDLRTFRDEKGYVVDVVKPDGAAPAAQAAAPAKSGNEGTPSPEAAAAAVHAAATAPQAPQMPPVETPSPRRGGQSSALPNAALPPAATAAAVAPAAVAPAPVASAPVAAAPMAPAAMAPAAVPPAAAPPAAMAPTAMAPTAMAPAAPAPMPPAAPAASPMPPAAAMAAPVAPPAASLPASPQTMAQPPQSLLLSGTPQLMLLPQPPLPPLAQIMAAAQAPKAPPPIAAPPQQAQAQSAPAEASAQPAETPRSAPPPTAMASAGPVPNLASAPQPSDGTSPRRPQERTVAPGAIGVELGRDGANLKLSFPFKTAAPVAVFHRADTLWVVFDSTANLDLSALDNEPTRTIRSYTFSHTDDADVVRLRLDRPHLASIIAEGPMWTLEIGDTVLEPPHPLEATRNILGANRASISVAFNDPQRVHRLADPDIGDKLLVVTAFGPERGFINNQDYIELHVLASTQGIVVAPLADDVAVNLAADKVVIDRPNGLTLSPASQTLLHGRNSRTVTFDSQIWGSDREGSFTDRQAHLINVAAQAPETKRMNPRLNLARFYLARDMYPEAKGVLDVAISADKQASDNASAIVLRAIAEVMMNRPEDALKDLADPAVGDQHDAPLWRALAYSLEGQWARARQGFKTVEAAVATLPIELQRVALMDEMRSAIETGDYDSASAALNDFQTIGVPRNLQPELAVMMGRLDEGLGRSEDALQAYRTAADSWDRPSAAQGRLRETLLEFTQGDAKRDDVVTQLESLTTVWRGDDTEIEALKVLAHLYTEDGRYRDAFYVMRSAMASHPNSGMTHQIQDEAAATFDALFLTAKGDTMPPIDALALFYDFRELTPVGSRGDEMIRRLADRLVAVDLLDQASDLLQYQVDHRLQGAARAQIAARLAVVYLMNRKPDRALAVLRGTRTANVSDELRNQRLLLEGRALSDTGRPDLALEVVANLDGREVTRLRSDILWSAKRWDESAEQIELMYGDRYKDFTPLSDVEQQDILRAEIGFALSSDTVGLSRFREKYAAKMAATPDGHVFEIVSAPLGSSGDQFGMIAHAATSIDTLEGFLRDMKARYPESAGSVPLPAGPMSSQPGSTPASSAGQRQPATPALPPTRPASGRSAQNGAKQNTMAAKMASVPKKPAAAPARSATAGSGRSFATASLDSHVP
jgi:tetratricopeptide (TPR) repeat protein